MKFNNYLLRIANPKSIYPFTLTEKILFPRRRESSIGCHPSCSKNIDPCLRRDDTKLGGDDTKLGGDDTKLGRDDTKLGRDDKHCPCLLYTLHSVSTIRLPTIRTIFLPVIYMLLSAFSSTDFNKNNAEFISLLKDTKITVVAPASGESNELLSNLRNIASLKLNIPNDCFTGKSFFHSADDKTRLLCLEKALTDQSDNVIWTLRGGYGSAKLIPELQRLNKPIKEKFFIGFSDMTALHIFLSQEWGWKTIHGNGIIEILKPTKDRQNFIKIAKIISGKETQAKIKGLSALNPAAKSSKIVTGNLTGGNLTIVQTSIGTSWQIKTADKILFLEDVSIKPYQLDRTLHHLKQAGLLDRINAIIFGTCGSDNEAIIAALTDFATTLKIPVFKTNRFGHERVNDPIIYNTNTKIILTDGNQFELIMQCR